MVGMIRMVIGNEDASNTSAKETRDWLAATRGGGLVSLGDSCTGDLERHLIIPRGKLYFHRRSPQFRLQPIANQCGERIR